MSNPEALYTIGEIARRTGTAVRTVRFWSDEGLVPPTTRSATGYRLYDVEAVARVDLVRTLRELGADSDAIRAVLDRQATVADVAAAHAEALDVEIRVLKVRRAVLRAVAHSDSSAEEMRIMHKMAKLSAAERKRMIDEFVDAAFDGIPDDAPGAHIAQGMRMLPPELPDDPDAEQVEAWVELAELMGDESFRLKCRQMALLGATEETPPFAWDQMEAVKLGSKAVDDGVAPESEAGQAILHKLVDADVPDADRAQFADIVEAFTDRRVERYWTLLATLNGWPQHGPTAPAFEWLIAALRARS